MLNNDHKNTLCEIINVLRKHIDLDDIDVHTSFVSLGISSLRSVQLILDINLALNTALKTHDLFSHPTPYALANYIATKPTEQEILSEINLNKQKSHFQHEPIAIIAMDCKYPGAEDCETLWKNCITNKESISFFNENEKIPSHKQDASYDVYARGVLRDIEYFDAKFFNYSQREASLSDPQHRLFLEAAWKALEKAGYATGDKTHGKVGVYASMNDSTYILDQYALQAAQTNLTERFALQRLMSSQFLATKVSYLLNCTGPSITVQTACSSSLVAIVLACQQLASFECDMAIAGGVSIVTPQDRPYLYQQGNIYSPDGHCRPFDADAQGTVFSNGLGVVVLKRLSEAVRDRDSIVSVIKGYSLNNDGAHKASYAAPSMQGQLDCILSAHSMANIEAGSIQYVEAHGTGTLIGDPIEIEALTKAFRQSTSKEQFCAIGSIKANIGHTHVAAGVAGLIKASLALQQQQIPPTLHFKSPNPDIDFRHSPFYVNTRVLHWRKMLSPRRAGVSAFGVGGTNAHVILEEAPKIESYPEKRKVYSILLSAKSKQALQGYHDRLIHFIENQNTALNAVKLADLAYTLQVGRNHYRYRSGIVCENLSDALNQLKVQRDSLKEGSASQALEQRKIVFLFTGQNEQYIHMSRGLYNAEPMYRKILDECLSIASKYMNIELRDIVFPKQDKLSAAQSKLFQTHYTHPILFSIEYALAKLLQHWGIIPDVMLGHSLGEYVAACLAGVFSLEEAIRIVCARGNAISLCDEGAMLSVPLSQNEIQPFCTNDVSIAVQTAPHSGVLSGSILGIQAAKKKIEKIYPEKTSAIMQLKNLHPFHTALLAKATAPFLREIQSIAKNPPKIPYVSNLTGNWITSEDVLNDQYWIDHMLKTVQLSQCMTKLLSELEDAVFVEVGPGRTLLSSLQMHTKDKLKTISILSSFKKSEKFTDESTIATAVKELWCHGCVVDWKRFYATENRNRIPLPTYPFQKQRFWVDQIYTHQQPTVNRIGSNTDLKFYVPSWICDPKVMQISAQPILSSVKRRWIIFANQTELCERTCQALIDRGEIVVKIFQETDKNICNPKDFCISLKKKSQYDRVFEKVISDDLSHYAIIHFWGIENTIEHDEEDLLNAKVLYQGLYSGIFIAQALSRFASDAKISWTLLTTAVHAVLGNEQIDPLKSGVLSLCRVLPLEHPKFYMTHIDIDATANPDSLASYANEIINQTSEGLFTGETGAGGKTFALRNKKYWVPTYSQIHGDIQNSSQALPRINAGVYVITGGLGGMGLTVAEWFCHQNSNITLVLISRSEFPGENASDELEHCAESTVSKKILILKQMIDKGCRVEILQADIADYERMKTLIHHIETQLGTVKGIFHLAGVSGKGLTELKKIDQVQAVLRPKVQGLRVLIKLFRDKELDFFMTSSSLTAIVGGVGQIDYCAANIYLDYYLGQNPLEKCQQTLTINWNAWRSVGMAVNVGHATHCQFYAGNSITPEQGIEVLNKLRNDRYNQVIVSRYSPEEEIKRIQKTFQCSPPVKANLLSSSESEQNNIHDIVKDAWEKVLGVIDFNEKASFYDYGGDSLALIQLIAILEKRLDVKIILQDFIQYTSTLGAMVHFVKNLTGFKPV